MPVLGKPRFNGLAVLHLDAAFVGPSTLTAKAAFIDSTTGKSHGQTKSSGPWSKPTLEALEALRKAAELDIARRDLHLEAEVADEPPLQGLGEHLTSDGEPL